MQYTKPMIELVFEIRRRVNANTKPGIKLANPDLLVELVELYVACEDTVTKALIKELLSLAGGDWSAHLADKLSHINNSDKEKQSNKTSGSHRVKVYRGQTSLQERASPSHETDQQADLDLDAPEAPVRYYRGVRIA